MDISSIITTILNSFSFGIVISINAVVYLIIKFIEEIKHNTVSKLIKIIVTIISSIIIGFVYYKIVDISFETLLNSCICAPVIWDWIIKPIFHKFKIDYTNND